MNVSFSTRGWQDIPWEDQIRMAQTMRFGGVELYNVQNTPALTDRGGPLHKYNAAATARELWQAGLRIPCFDTSCDISGTDCTASFSPTRCLTECSRRWRIVCQPVTDWGWNRRDLGSYGGSSRRSTACGAISTTRKPRKAGNSAGWTYSTPS